MPDSLWRILIGLVIIGQGAGHIEFLGPMLGRARWGQTGRSWLLSGRVPDKALKVLGEVVWILAVFGFMAAGGGLIGQHEWWRGLAVVSASASMLGLALFGLPIWPVYTAGLMDVVVLAALVLFRWPSAALVGP